MPIFLSLLSVAHRCRKQQLVKVLSTFSKVKLVANYSRTRFKDLKARIETSRWFWCPFVNEEGCEEKFLDKYNLFHQFLSPPSHTHTLQGRQNYMPNNSLGRRSEYHHRHHNPHQGWRHIERKQKKTLWLETDWPRLKNDSRQFWQRQRRIRTN